MATRKFVIVYDPKVRDHLRAIDGKHHTLIRDTIEEQLRFEPDVETRNRKPLRQPAAFDADWEIRFGPRNQFRALYAIDEANGEVQILAVGVKERDRLRVGGEEIEP